MTLMVPTLFLLELLPYGLCLTGLQCLRIKRIFHGLIYVKMEEEQVKRPSSQEGDISSTDQLLIAGCDMVECAAIDHPVGFLDESLHTLPSEISQSQAEVLMFEFAWLALGVSMEGREEEVRCLVRDILAKEGILSKSLKPPKSEKKVKGRGNSRICIPPLTMIE